MAFRELAERELTIRLGSHVLASAPDFRARKAIIVATLFSGDKWPAAKMFRFVTAFYWCSGGYDLFDDSQNGCSCHGAATLKLWIAA
jgi:hypothetical protein